MKKNNAAEISDRIVFYNKPLLFCLEGVTASVLGGSGGAVAYFDMPCGAYIVFRVVGAVFHTAMDTVFGFAVARMIHHTSFLS